MLKVFLDKLLLKNPSSARTTLKVWNVFWTNWHWRTPVRKRPWSFLPKSALKNPQFGQTILAVEACKEPAIRGQNLRFYLPTLNGNFPVASNRLLLTSLKNDPEELLCGCSSICPKIPHIASRSFPNRDFLDKMSNWGILQAAFGKNPLQASRSFPNLGLFNANILVKKQFFQTSFGSFGKVPYKYKSLKKRFKL